MCTDDIGKCRNSRKLNGRFTDDMGRYSLGLKSYAENTDDIGSYQQNDRLFFSGEISAVRQSSYRRWRFSDDMAPFCGKSLTLLDLAKGLGILVAVLALAGIALLSV